MARRRGEQIARSGPLPCQACRPRPALGGSQYGQGLTEYLVVVALVAILVIVGVRYFSSGVSGQLHNATGQFDALSAGGAASEQASRPAEAGASARQDEESGGDVSPTSSAGRSRAPKRSAGPGADLDRQVDALSTGVGDRDVEKGGVETITINWFEIGSFAGLIVVIGVAVVFLKRRKKAAPGAKRKKRFSILSGKSGFPNSGGESSGEEGQVLVIGLIVCVGLVMVAVTVANVGMMVAQKIQLQDTVDAAAYSAAVQEARYMNLSAYLNRTMIANYDTMAFDTALWSMADAGDHEMAVIVSLLYQIDAVLILFPFTTAFGVDLDDFIDLLRDDVHKPLHDINHEFNGIFAQDDDSTDINGLIETYNLDILSTYQGLLYAAQQASRHEVIREVAKRNDPDAVTTTVLGLGAEAVSYDELAKAVDWVVRDPDQWDAPFSQFQSAFNRMAGTAANETDNPLLLAATTEASLNRFSAGRQRDGTLDTLRSFGIGNILPLGALETALDIECNIEEVARAASPAALFTDPLDCNAHIELNLGFNLRDGFEDKADQEHVPFIARQRMREVTLFGLHFNVSGLDGLVGSAVKAGLKKFVGDFGHTSAEKHADIGNVANSTFSFSDGIDFARAFETFKLNNFQTCVFGLPVPSCGLNSMNMLEAEIMLPNVAPPDIPPLFIDDHWDGTFDGIYPVSSYQLIPPGVGNVEVVEYTVELAANGTEAGVPKYDWKIDLDNVGFPNYIYPRDGAEERPTGTSGGNKENFLTGPSIAVVGTKEQDKIHGLPGLGLGNPYSLSALARGQVYYLRNPNRPDEQPSLFNPHWVARLAPIDGDDSPELLKQGLPFVAGVGVPLTPTH